MRGIWDNEPKGLCSHSNGMIFFWLAEIGLASSWGVFWVPRPLSLGWTRNVVSKYLRVCK